MDEDYIGRRVLELREKIASSVKEPTLSATLLSKGIISDDDESRIRTKMQSNTFEASLDMMDCVTRSESPAKWKNFLEALEKSGYEYIRLSVMSPHQENNLELHANSVLRHFTDELADGMAGNCIRVSNRLWSQHILSEIDKDNIKSECQNKGDINGNLMLLDRMKCRAPPRIWYCGFLQALLDEDCKHLVENLEPEFLTHGEKIFDNFEKNHRTVVSGNNEGDMAVQESTISVHQEVEMETNDLDAQPSTHSLGRSISSQSEEEKFDDNTDLKQVNANLDMDRKIEEVDDCSKGDEELSDDNSMESDSEGIGENYALRSYQEELTKHANNGHNTIICSETGTGKTWVALDIIRKHFEAATEKRRKVAYMAKTGILVKQTAGRFQKHLPKLEIKLITSEDDDSKQLKMWLEFYDVVCFTPQILLNNMDDKVVKSLTEFSMLILDECHNTKGNEPYSKLMRTYHVEKSENVKGLPQVIGMTASIGVGKSRTDDEAVEYILKIMAVLDVQKLSTVEENIDSLSKHISRPREEKINLQTPNDPCKRVLMIAIEETEDLLEETALMQPDLNELTTEKPEDKGTQEYNRWTVNLLQRAQLKVDDEDIARDICACARYLNTYSSALEVNRLLTPKDIRKFIAEKHQTDSVTKDKHTKTEGKLYQIILGVQKDIRIKSEEAENPNVRTLSNTLKNMLDAEGEDSRALVFVKARATCKCLADFLNNDLKKSGYKASPLYGKENSAGDKGMPEGEQTGILKQLEDGFYKIIVCTSIATEGIDIPQCNIVISYDYMGNEITKVQMEGRARQKNSTVALFGDEDKFHKHRHNAYKASMMTRALKEIKYLKPEEIKMKVRQFQREEMKRYQFQVATEDSIKRMKIDKDLDVLCGVCSIFVCFVTDIRKMRTNHIVICKDFLDKVDVKRHKKPLKYDGINKQFKMNCKKCGNDWGMIGEYKGLDLHVLRIGQFKFRNNITKEVNIYKKGLPYSVQEITPDEIKCFIATSSNRQCKE